MLFIYGIRHLHNLYNWFDSVVLELRDIVRPKWNINGNILWADDCDFDGQDIDNTADDIENCGQACYANTECSHFSWWHGDGTCYLKKWKGSGPVGKDSRCGFITVGDDEWKVDGLIRWADNCNFGAKGIYISKKTKKEECAKKCLDNEGCTHFTWYSSGVCSQTKISDISEDRYAIRKNDGSRCGSIQKLTWTVDGQVYSADYCAFPGQDLPGNPTKNVTKEDCGKNCLADSKCDHFTWNLDNTCYMKMWIGAYPTRKIDSTRCGFISVSPAWTSTDGDIKWADNCIFHQTELTLNTKWKKTKKEDCAQSCYNNASCTHFNWFPNGYCFLKEISDKSIDWIPNRKMDGSRCGLIQSRLNNEAE